MVGQAVGDCMIDRPSVRELTCGLVMGNALLGIACGVATQLVHIALVTPGSTASAGVRAISYISIPLAMVVVSSRGLSPFSNQAANMVKSLGTLVGTIGSVLFYSITLLNLAWQSFGWRDIEDNKLDGLYAVNSGWSWVSHLVFSLLPTVLMAHFGVQGATALRNVLSMNGILMKTLFTVGAMLPCVDIAILLRQIVNKSVDFIPSLVGFISAVSLKLNSVSIAIISLLFAVVMYEIEMGEGKAAPVAASTNTPVDDNDEEDGDI